MQNFKNRKNRKKSQKNTQKRQETQIVKKAHNAKNAGKSKNSENAENAKNAITNKKCNHAHFSHIFFISDQCKKNSACALFVSGLPGLKNDGAHYQSFAGYINNLFTA